MESGGKEQNYWPGFVDALSNVVLTLVFVLVVFVFALVMASSKVEQKAQEIIDAAKADQDPNQMKELRKQLEEAKLIIQSLREELAKEKEEKKPDIIEAEAELEKIAAKTPISMKVSGNSIVLVYPAMVSVLNEKTMAELDEALKKLVARVGPARVEMLSSLGKESYSVAHRLAYYRAMNLRNFIINKNIGAEADITSRLVKPGSPDDGRVEIILHAK